MEIGQALAARRAAALTEPLRTGGEPLTVLAGYAEGLLHKMRGDTGPDALRGVALMSPTAPELAQAVYRAGPAEGLRRLSAWLAEQDRAGHLSIPDPDAAAEMYVGMIMGHGHLRTILNIPHPPFDLEARARETAERFLAAHAVRCKTLPRSCRESGCGNGLPAASSVSIASSTSSQSSANTAVASFP